VHKAKRGDTFVAVKSFVLSRDAFEVAFDSQGAPGSEVNEICWGGRGTAGQFILCREPGPLGKQQQEIYIADRCLSHPHIVQLWDVFWGPVSPQRKVSLVYELMGKSLKCLLDDRVPTPPQVRTTTHHVCLALCFLHEMGFLHTDVKPPNILVNDTNGRWLVKLGDLGCCVEA
jgi:serine/threonine protein kinase